ncbi:gamma-glutamylcyclotransferase family protein [Alkaliphilus hydrothermalis]|uniref:Gamma-glutamylcyclotransferase family protein n=1 Tax=Alkaliphilus hydrothermalis TaxID=1482730 RepID=A0ABS2NRL2_9FIRM|nr:gamma-glutamylcyclotransferase family protein [Alkaliphilus hydrothermalis]MBM7615605.1 gamma-glutamylcyclotransferase (GGCT)/AIG2-like uncharacterized protein YtfP [Alkaliphilus hydrothermalis]
MITQFRRFNEENIGRELDDFVEDLRGALDELVDIDTVQNEARQLMESLIKEQDEDGFWGIIPSPRVDGDIRVAYWYETTYIASALMMKYWINALAEAEIIEGFEKALTKGLKASTGRGFSGHGFDDIRGRLSAVKIFKKGKVADFLDQFPNLCPVFTEVFSGVLEGLKHALENNHTQGAWGEDYKQEMEKALHGFPLGDGFLVFVYGTLMKGNSNHKRFLSNAKCLGTGVVVGYTLYDLGSYPGVKHSKEGVVKGEVYKINTDMLRDLDLLEGEGSLYLREKTKVICENQQFNDVYIYIYNNSVSKNKCIPFKKQPWRYNDNYSGQE